MGLVYVCFSYILWHYTTAWGDLRRIVGNYLWFIANLFSIQVLSRTLFTPWRRLAVKGGKNKEETYFNALLVNTLMRFVGFFIRACTILLGMAAVVLVLLLSVAVAVLWLFLPAVIFILLFAGIGYLMPTV